MVTTDSFNTNTFVGTNGKRTGTSDCCGTIIGWQVTYFNNGDFSVFLVTCLLNCCLVMEVSSVSVTPPRYRHVDISNKKFSSTVALDVVSHRNRRLFFRPTSVITKQVPRPLVRNQNIANDPLPVNKVSANFCC
jgi:hypothetical protein